MNHHDDEAGMTETETDLIPELRAHDGITGSPLRMADGTEWLLADGGLRNALDALRDKIDDAARLAGEVEVDDVREAAFVLLRANYRLADGEAAILVMEADPQALTTAVGAALFGPADARKTYTTWAYSALLANGIDPAAVPGPILPHVLDHLVASGRAIAAGRFIDSAVAAPRLAAIRARVARTAAQAQAADAEAEPTP